jgi:hypothetical protein
VLERRLRRDTEGDEGVVHHRRHALCSGRGQVDLVRLEPAWVVAGQPSQSSTVISACLRAASRIMSFIDA